MCPLPPILWSAGAGASSGRSSADSSSRLPRVVPAPVRAMMARTGGAFRDLLRGPVGSAAPAGAGCRGRGLAGDPRDRLRGDEQGAGVDEVLTGGERRLGATAGDAGDGLDADAGHLAGVLRRVGRDRAVLEQTVDVVAATVNRREGHAGLPSSLERLIGAIGRRLVYRVDGGDVGVGRQAILHG